MKTIGIIGGIGPESTVEYYRFIIRMYRGQPETGTVNGHVAVLWFKSSK